MIELLFLASQIQCSADTGLLNIEVDVYHQQELVQTMSLNDSTLIDVASVNDLDFEYRAVGNNATCSLATPTETALKPGAVLPDMDGVYEQDSVQTLLGGLDEYEELFLVELGSTNSNSAAFDMQDVVFKVDNNPSLPIASIFAD
ncbi:MAG: hypothetical protein AAFR62_18810 [Cyanobacteria bacterium J06629_2]